MSVSTFTVLAPLSPAAQARADACQEAACWGCRNCGMLNLLECKICERCGMSHDVFRARSTAPSTGSGQ